MVGQRQEIQVFHLGGMVIGLLHSPGSVGKVRMGMELSEVEPVIAQLHRGLIGKGVYLSGLGFGLSLRRDMRHSLDNHGLILRRCFRDLDGRSIFLLLVCHIGIRRFRPVRAHGIVDPGAFRRCQGDLLSCLYAGAALGRSVHFETFHGGDVGLVGAGLLRSFYLVEF